MAADTPPNHYQMDGTRDPYDVAAEVYTALEAIFAGIVPSPHLWGNRFFQEKLAERCKEKGALITRLGEVATKYNAVLEIASAIGTKAK